MLPITIEKFLKEQKTDVYCEEALATVVPTTSLFEIDRDCFLVRRNPLDEALEKVVPVN